MSAEVLPYPTTRKRPYRNPDGWWKRPLPGNVQRLQPRDPEGAEPEPQDGASPALVFSMAILDATRRRDPELFAVIGESLKAGRERYPWDASFINAWGVYCSLTGQR